MDHRPNENSAEQVWADLSLFEVADEDQDRVDDRGGHACNMGLEGLVSKRRDSTYRPGRSPNWIKVKNRTQR